MIRFTIRRLLITIPVLLGVLFLVFTLSQFMPGDPVINKLGANYTPEQYAATAAAMGLDQPFFVQFWNYLVGVVTQFDLGTSYSSNRSVTTMILERVAVTMELGILSLCVTIVLGVPLGIISAIRQYSVMDYTVTTVSLIFAAIPGFWLAMMMMILFSLKLGWLPSGGIGSPQAFVMPVLAQGLMPLASIARMTRSSMLEVIRQDYIRTARAKGLAERVVIWRHALKNALIPIITVIGFMISMVFGGSIVIEMVFSMPGAGMLLMAAINSRDYPTIMGVVLFMSFFICVTNLIVDLAYAAVDPRIKAQFSRGKLFKGRIKPQVPPFTPPASPSGMSGTDTSEANGSAKDEAVATPSAAPCAAPCVTPRAAPCVTSAAPAPLSTMGEGGVLA